MASQPQSFTLDNNEVYTILPGGKVIQEGKIDPRTGELVETSTATPKGVDIGGQQYFQQPGADGQFERIPQEKAAPAAPSIETIGGIQFINQDGKLVPVDNLMKNMKENFVVTGDFQGAAAVHAWETRPSNQEYFDRMLQYVNAPADQLLISAIARGQGLVAPPPEEPIQRIGPQPEYLTEAFNMLRDQMQMGQPGEGETAQSIMENRFQEREDEAKRIANETAQFQLESSRVQADDAHRAAVTANETAVTANEYQSTINEMDINDRITAQYNLAQSEGGEPGDFSFPDSLAETDSGDTIDDDFWDFEGRGEGGIPKLQSDFESVRAQFNKMFGGDNPWSLDNPSGTRFGNYYTPADEFLAGSGLASGGATIQAMLDAMKAEMANPDGDGKLDNDETQKILNTEGNSVGDDSADDNDQGLDIKEEDSPEEVLDTIENPVAGRELGQVGEDEVQRAGTTGAGMTQAQIFDKYPFLAPEGWGELDIPTETRPAGPMSEEQMDVYGSTLGPTEEQMDVYGSTIPEPGQPGQTRREAMLARDLEALKDPAGIVSGINKARDFIGSIPGIQDIPFENISGDVRRRKEAEAIRNQMMDIPSEPYEPDEPVFEVDMGTPVQAPTMAERIETFESQSPYSQPSALAPAPAPMATPVGVGAPVPEDPDDYAGRWYDEGANGIRTGAKPTLVGESGPELALFPNGTEIVPLDRRMKPSQVRRLRRRGIRGMQEGGIVFGPDQYRARGGDAGVRSLPGYQGTDKFITSDTLSGLQSGKLRQDPKDLSRIYDPNAPAPTPQLPRKTASSVYANPLPLGIQKLQAGRSLGAPRGQLLRTAGIALPSAQARRRMLPSEREAFQGLGRMAGIPEGEFQQELGITTPSGARRTGSARMLPLSLRR